uniref:Uncharacterized protein n=1 Tax=Caenorhabditis japonica TaxID=281687 RepID=A0A2Q4SL60_CAEJA
MLDDNEKPHTALKTRQMLQTLGIQVFYHPLYLITSPSRKFMTKKVVERLYCFSVSEFLCEQKLNFRRVGKKS